MLFYHAKNKTSGTVGDNQLKRFPIQILLLEKLLLHVNAFKINYILDEFPLKRSVLTCISYFLVLLLCVLFKYTYNLIIFLSYCKKIFRFFRVSIAIAEKCIDDYVFTSLRVIV